MNDITRLTALTLSIAAVERDTGLSKDTLRVWERRYGFPTPGRDAIGERAYPLDQVEKLRVVKRLMDAGHRPGRIVTLPYAELQHLSASTVDQPPRGVIEVALGSDDVREVLRLIRAHDLRGLRRRMRLALARFGVARFVTEVVAPLSTAVGDAWLRGQMEIFEEHFFTEVVQVLLREAISSVPEADETQRPMVLLSTFPGEPHGLGLLMAEALLALDGCACLSLGVQTPLWDIALAASSFDADIVALGFTGCLNPNQVVDGLTELRAKLPPTAQIWAGGSAPVLHRRRVEGVEPIASLDSMVTQVQRWRAENA
jgi:DNA-binding transcriptional MerR regulator